MKPGMKTAAVALYVALAVSLNAGSAGATAVEHPMFGLSNDDFEAPEGLLKAPLMPSAGRPVFALEDNLLVVRAAEMCVYTQAQWRARYSPTSAPGMLSEVALKDCDEEIAMISTSLRRGPDHVGYEGDAGKAAMVARIIDTLKSIAREVTVNERARLLSTTH